MRLPGKRGTSIAGSNFDPESNPKPGHSGQAWIVEHGFSEASGHFDVDRQDMIDHVGAAVGVALRGLDAAA